MKNYSLLIIFILYFNIQSSAQITLSHNIGTTPIKTNITTCEYEEYWARTFTLSDFGISKNEQFILRSGQVAISNAQKGSRIIFNIYSIDENFPNSEIKNISYGNYIETPLIGNTPEIIQINFKTPIVIPSGVEKILIEVSQIGVLATGVEKVLIAGTEKDNDTSWFMGCRKLYTYTPTENLSTPVPNANFYINLTGEKRSIINSDSNIFLSHNVGDNTVKTNMASCKGGTMNWARKFVLSDFGITKNKKFIIKNGDIAISEAGPLANLQFNIYKIDKNFPSSFNVNNLIGSSQKVVLTPFIWNQVRPKIITIEFDQPIEVPADVEMILVEVKRGFEYGDAIVFVAGTEDENDSSWFRGNCPANTSGGYKTVNELWPNPNSNINFYITVNGEAKTILPFEILNNKNCSGETNEFSLTNISNVKSVIWDFNDPNSGINNTSNNSNTSHVFLNAGTYHVTANVEHIDGEKYTIEKEIEIFQSPVIDKNVSLKQCDDDTDGFSLFNLTEVNTKIVSNPSDYTINYFENKIDAESNSFPITNIIAYKNKTASTQKIWARVENQNGCYQISEITLIVSTTQIPSNFKKEYFVCDNDTDISDGISTFDFSSATSEIKNIFPANQQLNISYYKSVSDALSETNPITNISNYQNISSPNQQIIFTRVDSALDNECLGLGPHIVLNVESVPTANPVIIDPKCDSDRDGLFSFDTSTIESTIIGKQSNVDVTYTDENNNLLPSPLPNPFISSSQKITARVTNSVSKNPLGKCSDETIINFVVHSVPLANSVSPQIVCDNNYDGIYAFDTSNIEGTIIGNQKNIKITYFDKKGNILPTLPNPFITSTTDITVKVENNLQGTCSDQTTVSFIAREKPYFELKEEEIICMNNNPKLRVSVENQSGNYSYQWTDENNNTVSNSIDFTAIKGGLYSVIATNNYGCLSEKKQIRVIESKKALINASDIKVVEDSENNSIQINTANLGIGDYEFRLKDSNNSILIDYQTDPYFDNLIGGIYYIEINDKNGCGYITTEISVLNFPKFFTPNNDGVNDTWQLKGIKNKSFTKGIINIFDRYGKTIAEFSIFDLGWDGTSLGKKLPSNDYWFIVQLVDTKGVLRTRKGSFSLIRK